MSDNPFVLDMLGDALRDAVVAARARLGDDSVMARANEGLWLVERGGDLVVEGLSYDDAVAHVEALA